MSTPTSARLAPAVIVLAVAATLAASAAACGEERQRPPICAAQEQLRAAVREVGDARTAEAAGDTGAVASHMAEVERLVANARGNAGAASSDADTASAASALLEAANYLQFIVDDARAAGQVDWALAQFASREINRAATGAGGPPPNC